MDRNIYGYVRVSSKDQNIERQVFAMKEYNIPSNKLFIEKKSGKNFDRPIYKKLKRKLKKGDLLIIKSIDRLGRNYDEITEEWRNITKIKKADIKVIDMPLLDTTYGKDLLGSFISDLVLQIMSFLAQNEREMIRQRQREGIDAALRRGVKFGNKIKEMPENFHELYDLWEQEEITATNFAEMCDVSRTTLYKRINDKKNKIKVVVAQSNPNYKLN